MTKNLQDAMLGLIGYGVAMLLFLQLKIFSFIVFLLIIILIIVATKLLYQFWIDVYNLICGLLIFIKEVIRTKKK